MTEFKFGDRLRVRAGAPYAGRTGTVDGASQDIVGAVFSYHIRLDIGPSVPSTPPSVPFLAEELEPETGSTP